MFAESNTVNIIYTGQNNKTIINNPSKNLYVSGDYLILINNGCTIQNIKFTSHNCPIFACANLNSTVTGFINCEFNCIYDKNKQLYSILESSFANKVNNKIYSYLLYIANADNFDGNCIVNLN